MGQAIALSGRVEERRLLANVIQNGGVGVLSGEPGSGKTTLLKWVKAHGETNGFVVVSCQPAALEESIAASALSEFLLDLGSSIAMLDPLDRETLESLIAGRQLLDRAAARQSVTALLSYLVGRGPVLVAIDDMQWIDEFSAEVLTYAIRRACRSSPVVTAVRVGAFSPMAEALRRSENSEHIRVGAMSERDLANVAALELGASTPICLTIAGLAAGSPLRARELARLARNDRALVLNMAHIEVELNPFSLGLRTWTIDQLEVLFAATHVRQCTAPLLRSLFGDKATKVLYDGELEGLLVVNGEGIGAAHALVLDAVAAALPASDRARVHSLVVATIEEPLERARHLSLSDAPRSVATAKQITDGSSLAYNRGLFALAYQLADRVPDFLPADAKEELARAQLWLAHLEYRQDLDEAARDRLVTLSDSGLSAPLRIDVMLMLANVEAWSSDAMTGIERFVKVLEADDSTSQQQAEAATHLAILSIGAGSAAEAFELAKLAREQATPSGGQLLAEAEAIFVAASLFAGHGFESELLDSAISLADIDNPLSLQGPPVQWAPFLWVWTGDPRADEGFVWRRRILSRLGCTAALSLSLSIETRLLLEKGRRGEATTLVIQSRDRCEYEGPLTDAMVSIAEARLIAHCGGSIDEAQQLLRHADDILERAGMGFGLIESATVKMSLLSRSDGASAIDFGLWAMDRHFARGIVEPSLIPGVADLLEAIAFGDHSRRDEVFRLFDVVPSERKDLALLQAWRDACLSASAPKSDATLLVHFADDRAAAGDVFWSARADLAAGRVFRRSGRRRDAARRLERATASFLSMDAFPWASLSSAELDRVERRPATGVGELTDAQRRVAQLAAAGKTNKEIAALVFVAEKTVEATLSSAFRKLGISRRSMLHLALEGAETGDH